MQGRPKMDLLLKTTMQSMATDAVGGNLEAHLTAFYHDGGAGS